MVEYTLCKRKVMGSNPIISNNTMTIFSPLEQFIILPVFTFDLFGYEVIITNSAIILAIVFFVWYVCSLGIRWNLTNKEFHKKPIISLIFLSLYTAIVEMLKSNVKNSRAIKFFPLIFFIFLTILSLNLIGLIPYSFTVTSHIVATLAISLSIFLGMVIISIQKHGFNFLLLFKPSGIPMGLLFLLTPIEVISFIVKPISLAIRLFANMMAGHTLLKVIGGFAFTLSLKSGVLFLLHYVPLLVIVPLYGLEFAVALIQSFVFTTLLTIYLNESLNLH